MRTCKQHEQTCTSLLVRIVCITTTTLYNTPLLPSEYYLTSGWLNRSAACCCAWAERSSILASPKMT